MLREKNKWILVIVYRKVTEKTIDDRYLMPNISDILNKLGKCMYFATLDLTSGFDQIEVNTDNVKNGFHIREVVFLGHMVTKKRFYH